MAVSVIHREGFPTTTEWQWSVDLDSYTRPGMWMIATSNYYAWVVLFVFGNGSDTARQLVFGQNFIHTRTKQSGTWENWRVIEEHAVT